MGLFTRMITHNLIKGTLSKALLPRKLKELLWKRKIMIIMGTLSKGRKEESSKNEILLG